MADLDAMVRIWRQSLELNLRYYNAMGQLTADYWRDLMSAMKAASVAPIPPPTSPRVDSPGASPMARAQPASWTQPAQQAPATTTAPLPQAGVMVLEGTAGSQGWGVFLVSNNLDQQITGRVVASSFSDPNGLRVSPVFTFDPEVITLASGEQMLVRVIAAIDESFEPDVRYRGNFTVPELSVAPIPIVVRRRLDRDLSAADESSTAPE